MTTNKIRQKIVKKHFHTIIMLFLSITLNAQNNTFVTSTDEHLEEFYPTIFGIGKNSFYTISRHYDNEFILESYSINSLKRELKTQIKYPKIDGKIVEFRKLLCFNDHIYLIATNFNKKNRTYTAYLYEIGKDGVINPNYTIIDEMLDSDDDNKYYFGFELSNDSNNLLAYHIHDVHEAKISGRKIFYKVINKELKIAYSNVIEMEGIWSINNAILDEKNNLSFLQKKQIPNKIEKDSTILSVCSFNSQQNRLYKSEIIINENLLLDINLQLTKNGQLFCSGNYAIDKKFGGDWAGIRCMEGVFYALLDNSDLKIISQNKKNLVEEFSDNRLYSNYLKNSFILNNERIVLICEYQLDSYDTNRGYSYVRGSVITTSFSLKNKSEVWVKKTENKCPFQTISYLLFCKENNFKLIYNCNRQIDFYENGTIEDKNIFDDSQGFTESLGDSYFQINNETLILPTNSKKYGYRFTKISFNK